MKDTDRIIAQLRALPPDLHDPVDRFERIKHRAHRQRRNQRTAALVGGLAALALAVPIAAQLLPERAEVIPGGGVTEHSSSPLSEDEATTTASSGNYVDADEVARELTKMLDDSPQPRVAVDCPDDVEATKGATTVCQLTTDYADWSLDVTVRSVDGDHVEYMFTVVPRKDLSNEPVSPSP